MQWLCARYGSILDKMQSIGWLFSGSYPHCPGFKHGDMTKTTEFIKVCGKSEKTQSSTKTPPLLPCVNVPGNNKYPKF